MRSVTVAGLIAVLSAAGCAEQGESPAAPEAPATHAAALPTVHETSSESSAMADSPAPTDKIVKTDEQWRQQLTPEQYRILRQKGTERAFTGAYATSKDKGTYLCAGCGQPLFASEAKYDSGTGWPSYYEPIAPGTVEERDDSSWFMKRTEIVCSRCEGHLGHVFNDGPQPTGLRYCMNSAALKFVPAEGDETGR